MNGKSKCKLLKEIRSQIAADNDIEFITAECKFQGECAGTCPKCEAEVRYLEEQLRKRQSLGKKVAVAGIAATLMVSTAGCDLDSLFGISTDTGIVGPDAEFEGKYVHPKEDAPKADQIGDSVICIPE